MRGVKLAHMKHFADPMTSIVHTLPSFVQETSSPASRPFVHFLRARFMSETDQPLNKETWTSIDVSRLVADARSTFKKRARALRVGLHMFSIVRRVCVAQDEEQETENVVASVSALSGVLKGRTKSDIHSLTSIVK